MSLRVRLELEHLILFVLSRHDHSPSPPEYWPTSVWFHKNDRYSHDPHELEQLTDAQLQLSAQVQEWILVLRG